MDTELQEALDRVRGYRDQLRRSDEQSDKGSLDRARDLELLYQSKKWVGDLEPPKHQVWRGRPVDPESRNRFATWVLQQTGLSPTRVKRLHTAHEIYGALRTIIPPAGERTLAPLVRLKRAGYGDHLGEVYDQAVKLAGGGTPTSAETSRAVRDFLAKWTRTDRRKASDAERLAQYRKRVSESFTLLLGMDPELAGATLNDLIDTYNARLGGPE